jgi:hypothetical protein
LRSAVVYVPSFQLEEQRSSHSEELRRSLLEAEARATELRVSIVSEKDKQFAAEKDALETRLRAAAAADLELAAKRFEAKLGEGLEAQVGCRLSSLLGWPVLLVSIRSGLFRCFVLQRFSWFLFFPLLKSCFRLLRAL